MQKILQHTLQPSLQAPPVYRHFLGGGTQSLRLSAAGVAVIAGLGVLTSLLTLLLSMVFVGSRPPWEVVSSGSAATIGALSTAAIAAGWLGSRLGLFSGCLYLMSGQILLATASPSDRWLAAMATTAVAAFAVASVAGRMPLVSGRWPVRVFYVLTAAMLFFNPAAPAIAIVVVCVLVLATEQNCPGLRFFADPPGIAVLTVVVLTAWLTPGFGWNAGWNTVWPGGSIFSIEAWWELTDRFVYLLAVRIPFDALPWGPLVLVAIVVGIRQGHYSTPFGQFLAVWLLVPLGMALAGLLGQDTAAVLTFPPLAIFGGIGLGELLVKISRLRRRRRIPIN